MFSPIAFSIKNKGLLSSESSLNVAHYAPHYIIRLLLILVRSMATFGLVLAVLLMLLELMLRSEILTAAYTRKFLLCHIIHLLFLFLYYMFNPFYA
jgi:hypothetical protein